jgi:hypothetical protein
MTTGRINQVAIFLTHTTSSTSKIGTRWGQTASVHLLSLRKLTPPLSGLVHQIISVAAAETVTTDNTTAFRGLFEQTRGIAARSTTSDYLVAIVGLRTTDTHPARQYPVSVVNS